MKSPFPGMDPYLEMRWNGVHQRLIVYSRDALQSKLPPDLRANIEKGVFIEKEAEHSRSIVPCIYSVGRSGRRISAVVREDSGVAVAQPFLFTVDESEITESFIEIRDGGEGS